MKVRIVTPTLGKSPWLSEALDSITLPPGRGGRIIVAPVAECSRLAGVCHSATIVPQTDAGLYAALNVGFRSPGDWTVGTWINDDDRLIERGFQASLAMLERRPELAAVFGRVSLIDGDGNYLSEIPVTHFGEDLGPLLASGLVPLAQPGTVFRREVFERLGGFDESLKVAGDMEFFRCALAAGFKFGFVNARVAEFRVHRGQISRGVQTRLRETAALKATARDDAEWVRQERAARWRFRWSNRWVYADRIRRHGFVSMERLSARE